MEILYFLILIKTQIFNIMSNFQRKFVSDYFLNNFKTKKKSVFELHLPSNVWGPFCNTTETFEGSENVTNPNPLERPDSAFFITTQSITSPYLEKYRWRLSWEVSQERPPTKSFL